MNSLQSLLPPQAYQAARAAKILRQAQKTSRKLEFYGAAKRLQACRDPEVIISGPSETGKTLSSLVYLNNLALQYPGMQGAMVRKTYQSMPGSVLQTFKEKVLGAGTDVVAYGGEKPEWFDYPNGSRLWVGGMDNPSRVLSSERDVIYVNQAEELTLVDWETLSTRTTGRAGHIVRNGVVWAQLIGDCNPGGASHWIKQRKRITLLESRHEDNPTLFDPATGLITAQGELTLATLDALTGVRRDRLRFGRWVNAEGAVYEFDAAVHLLSYGTAAFPYAAIPATWRRIRVVDFGFTNPFVCLWIAIDPDGRMYVYRQLYMTQRTVKVHSAKINERSRGERYEVTVADHDAEDAATLRENGIISRPARKEITVGIQAVQERLKKAGDGKPRFFIMAGSLIETDEELRKKHKPVNAEEEFDVYVWPKAPDGKPIKEVPVDLDNHAMDCVRYGVVYVDNPKVKAGDVDPKVYAPARTAWSVGERLADDDLAGDEPSTGRWSR